jgi:hypothetical protein
MITGSVDQTEVKPNAAEEAKKVFVEPEISEPVDVIESTRMFQIQTGTGEVPPDIG